MIQVKSFKNGIKSFLMLLLFSNCLNAQCIADNTGNTGNLSNELLRPLAIGAGTYSQFDRINASNSGSDYSTVKLNYTNVTSSIYNAQAVYLITHIGFWDQTNHNDSDAFFTYNPVTSKWETTADDGTLISIYPLSAELDGVNVPIDYMTVYDTSSPPDEIFLAGIDAMSNFSFTDDGTGMNHSFSDGLSGFPLVFPYFDLGEVSFLTVKNLVVTMAIEYQDGRDAFVDAGDGSTTDFDWYFEVNGLFRATGYDYGDANGYASAAHGADMCNGNLYIGDVRADMENVPQAFGAGAVSGDTLDYLDDEGDLSLTPIVDNAINYTANIPYSNNTTGNATLAVWIDFNDDAVFESSEKQSVTVGIGSNSAMLDWTGITVENTATNLKVRMRLASNSSEVLNSDGFASNGEVEDHFISIMPSVDPCDAAASGNPDSDGDNVSDECDLDDDNDGILDTEEGCADASGLAKHIALLIDESGSIMNQEITDIQNGLTSFINTQIGSGNTISFVGMSHFTDVDNRTDHVLNVNFPTDGSDPTAPLDAWIAGFRNGRVGGRADHWASAFDVVVNDLSLTSGDEVIVVTDGANGSDVTTANYADTLESNGIHLFAIGVDSGDYFGNNPTSVSTAVSLTFDNVAGTMGNPIQEVTDYNVDFDSSEYDGVGGFSGLAAALQTVATVVLPQQDTDGDGLDDCKDLDSDGDGCFDVLESGGSDPDGDGIIGMAPYTYDSDGLVIGTSVQGGYDGVSGDEVIATQIQIDTQPVNETICLNENVVFNASAFSLNTTIFSGGNPDYSSSSPILTGIQYQWQEQVGGLGLWNDISDGGVYSGTNTNTLTITNPLIGMSTNRYRVVVRRGSLICPTISDEVNLTINNASTVAAGTYVGQCDNGSPITLTGTPTDSNGTWTGTGVTDNGDGTAVFDPVGQSGTISVTYTYANGAGCTASDTTDIAILGASTVEAGTYVGQCDNGSPITLTGTPTDSNGTWTGTGVTDNGDGTAVFDPVGQSGTISITYTYANGAGCTASDTTDIAILGTSTVEAGTYVGQCDNGSPITLTGTPTDSNGTWTGTGVTDNGDGTAVFDPVGQSGTISITYTYANGAGCTASDTTDIAILGASTVEAGTYVGQCDNGSPITLTGTPTDSNGTWTGTGVTDNGDGTAVFDPVGQSGTISVTYTYANGAGCTASDTTDIAILGASTVEAGTYVGQCDNGSPITLTGTPTDSNGTWTGTGVTDNGDGTAVFDPVGQSGTISVTYTYANGAGCTASDTTDIAILGASTVEAGTYVGQCDNGSPITLTGTPTDSNGTWTGTGVADNGDGTAVFDPVGQSGTISVTYTYANGAGCSGSDTTDIAILGASTVEAGTYVGQCDNGSPITLTGTPTDSNGTWTGTGVTDNGDGTAVFDPVGQSGTISITYTYANGAGCTASDTTDITMEMTQGSAPSNPTADKLLVCMGETVVLSADACMTGALTWYEDASLTMPLTSTTVNPMVTTIYYVSCVTVGGCQSQASSVTVEVKIDCDGDGVTDANEIDPDGDGNPGPEETDPLDPCDFNADDITEPVTTNVVCIAAIEATKIATVSDITLGSTIYYAITIENIGNVEINNLTLTDTFLDAVGNSLTLSTGPDFVSSDMGSPEGTLLEAEIATYEATFIINEQAINAGGVSNSVLAVGEGTNDEMAEDVSDNGDDFDGNTEDDVTETNLECLKVFNEFSPNNDGVNDIFVIECIENYPRNTLEIYNRWGNKVYETKGYMNTWDGSSDKKSFVSNSNELPVGTYYYVLNLGNGLKPKAGWVYLNR